MLRCFVDNRGQSSSSSSAAAAGQSVTAAPVHNRGNPSTANPGFNVYLVEKQTTPIHHEQYAVPSTTKQGQGSPDQRSAGHGGTNGTMDTNAGVQHSKRRIPPPPPRQSSSSSSDEGSSFTTDSTRGYGDRNIADNNRRNKQLQTTSASMATVSTTMWTDQKQGTDAGGNPSNHRGTPSPPDNLTPSVNSSVGTGQYSLERPVATATAAANDVDDITAMTTKNATPASPNRT